MCRALKWEIGESEPHGFKLWSSQTNDFKIDNYHFLAKHSTLLGYAKDWFVQAQENVTDWDIRTWCWWPAFPGRQHYKAAMSAHYPS